MNNHKTTYLRSVTIFDDISSYHQELKSENDWKKKLRLFKNCFIALDIFRDSFKYFNFLLQERNDLKMQARSLKKRLEFINHLRNLISGHLEEKLLEKAVQWGPIIFIEGNKDNITNQALFTYKTLIESAINSFIDKESKQKIFNTEIDLLYPPDLTLFYNYVENLNIDSISFLFEIITILKDKIEWWENDKLLEMAHQAGRTDFKLIK
jgi:hypothetical protein